MRRHIYAFLAGATFAAGLAFSGMTRPSKVRGFLDFFGEWDLTLLFVLGPAVGIYALAMGIAKRRTPRVVVKSEEVAERMGLRFVVGCLLFGFGWGLVGICPGPSVVMLGQLSGLGLVFFVCMVTGIGLADRLLAKGK